MDEILYYIQSALLKIDIVNYWYKILLHLYFNLPYMTSNCIAVLDE